MNPEGYFGKQGSLSKELPGFEYREEQLKMAEAVAATFAEREPLLVEAGTGVGKSYAYLIPAIKWALENDERVVVSTKTINLQEQLEKKDIPTLQGIEGLGFKAVLAKGRSNYICLRKLYAGLERDKQFFAMFRKQDYKFLEQLEKWFLQTKGEGTKASLNISIPYRVWENVCVESLSCTKNRCAHFEGSCPYWRDRRVWESADIIITNHSLFFADLALRRESIPFLPAYGAVIFDEAHSLEDIAAENLGARIYQRQAKRHLARIYDVESGRGLFHSKEYASLHRATAAMAKEFDRFFANLGRLVKEREVRLRAPGQLPELSDDAKVFLDELEKAVKGIPDGNDFHQDAIARQATIKEIILHCNMFVKMSAGGFVYWVEGRQDNPRFCMVPIRVHETLKSYLWESPFPFVLTSATLAMGAHKKDCSFIRERLGLKKAKELVLGSPFDYSSKVRLFVPSDIRLPGEDPQGYIEDVTRYVKTFARKSEGGTFVLFTSVRDMNRVCDSVEHELAGEDLLVLSQGRNTPRHKLLEAFKADGRSVLFGVESFWQGVDVRGPALSGVVIVRLPFPVPSQPLVEARCEELRERGKSDFHGYSLPVAMLKLKQGFGRLVRTKKDSGFVAILDPRIKRRNYGRFFLGSLPKCPLITDPIE
ncbi:MAG: ATP-dependent DNA helicase [Planctomycetota bacterium]|nr:ATP-dependent DNA helicase [Planctomycetota bacterium]